jgi:hypothetical protein
MAETTLKSPRLTPEEKISLIIKAESGDQIALDQLRQSIHDPDFTVAPVTYLASELEWRLIARIVGEDPRAQELMCHKVQAMREHLAGPNPTPVEVALVEETVSQYLQKMLMELVCQMPGAIAGKNAKFYQAILDRATRRYLASLKALALVRKKAVPLLQMNIEQKQLNLFGTAAKVSADRIGTAESPMAARKSLEIENGA